MKKPIDIDHYLGDYTFQVVYSRWRNTIERATTFVKYLMEKGEKESDLFETLKRTLEINYIETVAHSLAFVTLYDIMISDMGNHDYPYKHNLNRKEYRMHLNNLFEYSPMT